MNDNNDVSRRSVAKGAAWATPALVAVAAARPAAASPGDEPDVTGPPAQGCKLPGKGQNTKDYRITKCFTNNDTVPVTITGPSRMRVNDVSHPATSSPASMVLAPGQSGCMTVTVYGLSDSAQASLVAIFTVSAADRTTTTIGATSKAHPCKK